MTDTITGILSAFCNENASGAVFNIGDSEEITILELAERIKRIAYSKSNLAFYPLPEDDPRRRKPNTSKAEQKLNWYPEASMDEGLNRTVTWFKQAFNTFSK